MSLPPGKNVIGCKWVFRVKENVDGSLNKYKARLVAKGFHQQQGQGFNETFSLVIKPVTIRTILKMALSCKWDLHQIDVNNAFLNGTLEEEVYMTQPQGFEAKDKPLVCKPNRAIYGLKQAPRAWFDKLKATLFQIGFTGSRCDPSLFVYKKAATIVYLLVYVDDIVIIGNSNLVIKQLIQKLDSVFSLKQLGKLDYFLDIAVKTMPNGNILLTQSKYIRNLLTKTNKVNSISSPMVSSCKLSKMQTTYQILLPIGML